MSLQTFDEAGRLPAATPTPSHATALIERNQRGNAPDRRRANAFAMAKPVVHVVDGDASVRHSLSALIRAVGWRAEVFATARAFLAYPRASVPGCLLLELTLPDIDGLTLQEYIAADRPSLPIIFITSHGDVPTSVRAMKAGAFEFLVKPLAKEALLPAIRDAIAFSKSSLERAAIARALDARYASLTPREREVLRGVATGLLNKQVAAELGISEITVKAHRGRVMRKMQAHSLAELVNLVSVLGVLASGHS
jgi:FixJ family two-component response regulator